MEETQLLRMVITLILLVFSTPSLAQDSDSWLKEALRLKQEGWDRRVTPALPDMTRPVAPLMAFVSFSMPEDSLKAILEQVDRVGGTVLLRGLVNNSFKDTATVVARLVGKNGTGFGIDPKLFSKYNITAVPAFVIPNGEDFDKISGNLSLSAALEALTNEGSNPEAAHNLLVKLRGG
jgi:type-F conjugative transfer system pilin assembly protein TrbC